MTKQRDQSNLFGNARPLSGGTKKVIKLENGLPPLDLGWVTRIANSPAKDSGYTRAYYSYPAKFQAHLPHALISSATRQGDLVCDPYCGGGTTGLESMILNRRFVGYDLSPFAILVSKVKTTRVAPEKVEHALPEIKRVRKGCALEIFDEQDVECIGHEIAEQLGSVFCNIRSSTLSYSYKNFLKLALIHTVKIIGRRDFTRRDNDSNGRLFEQLPKTAVSLFESKVRRMLSELTNVPPHAHKPKFVCASNHRMKIDSRSVDIIVTSPPYKDLDVEYGLLQLQRRELKRSKRSEVIWKILGVRPVAKDFLCGERGDRYWENLTASLIECRRILKPKHLAFFWIGFKTNQDRDTFCNYLVDRKLSVEQLIRVRLGADRVASSRSTHHGRETGMMKRDYLIVTRSV